MSDCISSKYYRHLHWKTIKTTEEEHHLSSASTGKVISVFWWMGTEVEQSKCFGFLLNK